MVVTNIKYECEMKSLYLFHVAPKNLLGIQPCKNLFCGGLFKKLPILNIFNPERSSWIHPINSLPVCQKTVEKLNVWHNWVTSYSKEYVASKKNSPQSPVTDRCPSYHWLGSAPLSSHEKPKEKVIVRECLNKTDIGYWPLANCYFRFQNAQNSRQCPNTSKQYLKQDHLRMNVAPVSKQ